MKKLFLTLTAIALLAGPAFAGKGHDVRRFVISNDNSLQGLSTVNSGIVENGYVEPSKDYTGPCPK